MGDEENKTQGEKEEKNLGDYMKSRRNKKPIRIKGSYREVYSAGEGKTFLIYRIKEVIPLEDE